MAEKKVEFEIAVWNSVWEKRWEGGCRELFVEHAAVRVAHFFKLGQRNNHN